MAQYGLLWSCIDGYGPVWVYTALYGLAQSFMALHRPARSCTILYGPVWSFNAPYGLFDLCSYARYVLVFLSTSALKCYWDLLTFGELLDDRCNLWHKRSALHAVDWSSNFNLVGG